MVECNDRCRAGELGEKGRESGLSVRCSETRKRRRLGGDQAGKGDQCR